MTFPDTTIEAKLFGVDTKFSFIRPVKRFEHSYYKLSLYGNLGEISKCFNGTDLIKDVQDTINENLDNKKSTWEDVTIQVQIIYKPHSNKAEIANPNALAEARKKCDDALAQIQKYNEIHPIPDDGDDKNKEQRKKYVDEYEKAYTTKEELLTLGSASAKEVFDAAKANYNNSKVYDGKDRPNNRIWIIGVKVDFGDMLSSENGSFKFTSFAVSFSYFGGEVSEDDKDSYKGKIDFIEGGNKSDEIFLKTQAIIEQNKFLQNLVLENITNSPVNTEEKKLKSALIERIDSKIISWHQNKKEKLGLIDLVNKSFDELTFLSFKIYEASKTINLKSNIIEKWNGGYANKISSIS
ncbi:hypothetical protein LNP80_02655 [Chryseobacterium sp. C-39]|uniref:Uncharacterized protein n=1 Tax=Chryseobacterium muglaense TaxID=2893752 RepID=A0A9Q3UUC1_9FLAO|nr:hypothetical protein [Chryseobacterium muglaense]MCC9033155.1 hypothetical protein [Chryseobacterium muglaense]